MIKVILSRLGDVTHPLTQGCSVVPECLDLEILSVLSLKRLCYTDVSDLVLVSASYISFT